MPIFEYVLVALLGSAGAVTAVEEPTGTSMRTLTADIVIQPGGGSQATGGSPGKQSGTGRKGRRHSLARRRYHKGRRHSKVTTEGKKATKTD